MTSTERLFDWAITGKRSHNPEWMDEIKANVNTTAKRLFEQMETGKGWGYREQPEQQGRWSDENIVKPQKQTLGDLFDKMSR